MLELKKTANNTPDDEIRNILGGGIGYMYNRRGIFTAGHRSEDLDLIGIKWRPEVKYPLLYDRFIDKIKSKIENPHTVTHYHPPLISKNPSPPPTPKGPKGMNGGASCLNLLHMLSYPIFPYDLPSPTTKGYIYVMRNP